jgi:putative lipoprotein
VESPQTAEEPEPQPLAYSFDCDDGTSVVSRLDANDDVMWVLLPDQAVDLGRVETASGTRYANSAVSFWLKGDELTLEIAGTTTTCTVDRFKSKVESVKLSGGDFWATGNEPGWVLEMYPDSMVFTTNYGEDRYQTGIAKVSEDARARMSVFRGETDGKVLVVTLRGDPCVDSMSGEEFETIVRIDFGGKVFDGCGAALH